MCTRVSARVQHLILLTPEPKHRPSPALSWRLMICLLLADPFAEEVA